MLEIYQRIWRATGSGQIVLVVLSLSVAALAVVPLQYQKDIINGLAGDMERHELLRLGAQFLGFLVLSAAVKLVLGYRMSIISETAIRLIRNRIYLKQSSPTEPSVDEPVQQGTLATMIAAEAEEVGKFAGAAIATPVMQAGILVSVVAFIAVNQPYLGLFAMGVVLPQALIVILLQKHINARIAERVKALRLATNRIVAEDIKEAEQAILSDFDTVYEARRRIYLFKQSSKFALNTINGIGTAGVLVLGGWLVLEGRADIGIVVAAVTGLGRIAQPWRELIAFYRELSAVRVKFHLLLPALPPIPDILGKAGNVSR
jgi:ABC-type bacteriocin/lantibiotic exporter with double-glycine peptidase domain